MPDPAPSAVPPSAPTTLPSSLTVSAFGHSRGLMSLGIERLMLRGAAVMAGLTTVLDLMLVNGQWCIAPAWWTGAAVAAQCVLCPLLFLAEPDSWGRRAVLVGFIAVLPTLLVALFVLDYVHPATAGPLPGTVPAWFLESVLLASALSAFVLPAGAVFVYGGVIAVLYTLVRLRMDDGTAWTSPYMDGAFTVVVALGSLGVVHALRSAAAARDGAARDLVEATAERQRQEALVLERARIDAFVHDDLLHLLLAAARPGTVPDQDITRLAVVARRRLANGSVLAPATGAADLFDRLDQLAHRWGAEPVVRPGLLPLSLPPQAARALERATREALRNSLRHAAGDGRRLVHRTITMRTTDAAEGTVTIEVADDGVGFGAATARGWGTLHSLMEPMSACGGAVHIDSVPGRGTRVVLTWPGRGPGEERTP